MGAMDLKDYWELNDEALITRILDGDNMAAAALLVERCGPSLKYLITHKFPMLGMEFDEVVSDVFLTLSKNNWKALRAFQGVNSQGKRCRLDTYISVIASRLLWKKMERRVKEIDWETTPIVQDTPSASSDRAQNTAEVMDAVMALDDPRDRELLILYKLQGCSADEVASRLGISTANVYTRCNRALNRLRALLEEGSPHV